MNSIPGAPRTRLAFIGFGEAGRILGEGLVKSGLFDVSAYDILLEHSVRRAAMLESMVARNVRAADTAALAVTDARIVISAVTARSAGDVANAVAPHIAPGAIFMDINSVSPAAKQANALVMERGGAHYVDAGVMESVPPKGIKVPMLLGGAKAAELQSLLEPAGMEMEIVSKEIGVASAIKMCRSVMIKGLEAMVIESFTTARAYGVEDALLASLTETFPSINWEQQGGYFFQRVIEHGRRRSEEVREVAVTVRDIGLSAWSADGTALRQAWVADLADAGLFGNKGEAGFARSADWRVEADRILAQAKEGKTQ